jgi:hypothetical protein
VCGEFAPGGDAEFAVGVREVRFDGLDAHEERRRNLAVCGTVGDEARDLLLRCRECERAAGAAGDASEFRSCSRGPLCCSERLEQS